ncbi:hypothetical protein WOLCODRAFT_158247 [Wolfiporia cocos MD-104 SS10]|uniref:Protein-S-isoprenylcysteine O-methyltransferase n=1 Tax=Wolfiporia cocos (strain MD-104) TaxID=742152 RepID=A0A2H3J5L2_WOLCO|nr:hypothetical protein WOLCODRAFT_158247 [Wolfiporia cocos MD-104 SS10]
MASLRITLLLAASSSTHLVFTDPSDSVKAEEKQRFRGGDLLTRIQYLMSLFLKSILWELTLSESAVLFALHYPCPTSAQLLYLLMREGSIFMPHLGITPLFIAGSLMQIFGFLIRRACFRTLGRHFTFALAMRDDHKLITNGPYAIVHHPSYTGGMMVFVGMLFVLSGRNSWWAECGPSDILASKVLMTVWSATTPAAASMLVLRTGKEDAVLREEFGSQWDKWAERTRYRLVPGLY